MFRILLSVALGHLLTDYVFQSRRLVEQKKQGKVRAYLRHGIIHYLCVIASLGFFVRGSAVSLRAQAVVVGLTLFHVLVDFVKARLTRTHVLNDGATPYILDQVVHLLAIFLGVYLIAPAESAAATKDLLAAVRGVRAGIIAVPVVYIAVVFGGGYLIRFLTRSLAEDAERGASKGAGGHLQNAGLYIGWLERFLVMTALLLQSPAMVGFIFAAKSIARYPELKTERFAEYFLIGTLLSLSLALLGGALLLRLLFHQILFPS